MTSPTRASAPRSDQPIRLDNNHHSQRSSKGGIAMTVVDIAAVDRRPECDVEILGANRGGSASQKHVVRTAQQSTAYKFRIGYTDAVAGRAEALAARLVTQGVTAFGREADIRELPD